MVSIQAGPSTVRISVLHGAGVNTTRWVCTVRTQTGKRVEVGGSAYTPQEVRAGLALGNGELAQPRAM